MSQYDPVAADFEEHAEGSPYNAYYDRPAVLGIIDELIGDLRGKRVLDVGCGPGLYAAKLLDRGAVVTGFDQSAEMIKLAERRLGSDVTLRVHDADEPLAWADDDSFDLAVMTLVLHHLERPSVALAELHRVLRPGARLVVSTVHPILDWRNLGGSYFADEYVEETWRGNFHVRYRRRPLDAWCADFYAAGLVIERLAETRPVSAMQQRYPEHFARLTSEPGFIVFCLLNSP